MKQIKPIDRERPEIVELRGQLAELIQKAFDKDRKAAAAQLSSKFKVQS